MNKKQITIKELKAFADLLYKNGFTVLVSATHPFEWLYFEKDGKFGTVQPDGFSLYNFGTVNKPNKEAGTGFRTASHVELKIGLANNAVNRPSWASQHTKVQLYKDVADFINFSANKSMEFYIYPGDMPKRYSLEELKNMPTIHEGHWDNVKFESDKYRVKLSRATVADGADYDNQVTVLELQNGEWKTIDQYEAK